jgi:hypothetical protein
MISPTTSILILSRIIVQSRGQEKVKEQAQQKPSSLLVRKQEKPNNGMGGRRIRKWEIDRLRVLVKHMVQMHRALSLY